MNNYKRYKSVLPETTIYNIRSILKDVDILLKEYSYENDNLFGCRLTINNDGLSVFDIGSNGKGRSYEYALASGYAEFMERLQNDIIYKKAPLYYLSQMAKLHNTRTSLEQTILAEKLNMDFLYDPKEVQMRTDDAICSFKDDILQIFNLNDEIDIKAKIIEITKNEKVITVPVYSYKEKKEILFPLSWALLATGSNGMCAGNTPTEAILQGMCEIFERYAATQLFFQQLTPPTIPIDMFAGSVVYDKIQFLTNKKGFKFIIKDCSLDKGLPVIGLIIINRKNHTYNFKLGADFVPEIALERCLTEVYQSKDGFIGNSYLNTYKTDENNRYSQMIKNGSGQWAPSIFYATPSYTFSGFNESLGKDDSVDLKYASNLICNLGSNLYIRDNSFLGFPAYYVIAPGLSSVCNNFEDLKENIDADPSFIMSEYNMRMDIHTDIKTIVDKIEFSLKRNKRFCFNDLIPYYHSKELQFLHPNLFLCMSYYYMENYQAAYENIAKFLKGKGGEYEYYYAVSEYISLRFLEKLNGSDVENLLNIKYGRTIASEVLNDMQNTKDVFKYYDFERHFNLDNMDTNRDSYLIRILKIEKKIQQKKRDNPICQGRLKELFT